ncbi:26S proteasome non-ATPase regulatory subunit 1 [Melipona quadrifasciata]|uniref:26S proteasome non-ATPase regulatory subunit 1 n=1 Tax=Melipona quadrifasciata TaxID=166423 RepID=A0A0M9A8T2_9HYME|nr:26S proteasome non-ATPase regulatory subunit 1 [Melipona quadrifasciata]
MLNTKTVAWNPSIRDIETRKANGAIAQYQTTPLLLEVYPTPPRESRDSNQPIANFRCISVAPERRKHITKIIIWPFWSSVESVNRTQKNPGASDEYVCNKTPEQCPSVVSLLAESYNPHVRYGAAMALGIACAGTGLKEAIALLDPMTNDSVNFVRQGALIASAMILIQQTEATCSRVKDFRALYAKVIVDKHEDVMAKFGAILAQGIIDAGGRNVTVSLQSRTGHTNMLAVVGALVFTQYWYWFPLAHCLALAFTPTCLIALNAQLKMPKLEMRSNARPSVYAYPAPLEEKKREEREKITTAVLSIAARARRRESERRARDSHEKMEVDPPETAKEPVVEMVSSKEKEEKRKEKEPAKEAKETKEKVERKGKDEGEKGTEKEKKEAEPSFEILQNPARVLRQQLKVIQLVEGSHYVAVKDIQIGGIVMVKHIQSDTEEELVEPVAAYGPHPEEEQEAEPPEPFEYTED